MNLNQIQKNLVSLLFLTAEFYTVQEIKTTNKAERIHLPFVRWRWQNIAQVHPTILITPASIRISRVVCSLPKAVFPTQPMPLRIIILRFNHSPFFITIMLTRRSGSVCSTRWTFVYCHLLDFIDFSPTFCHFTKIFC